MDKKTLVGVSLVAAIPAAALTAMSVWFFLFYTGSAGTVLSILMGITFFASAAVALFPPGLFLFDHRLRAAPVQNGGMEQDTAEALPQDAIDDGEQGAFDDDGGIEPFDEDSMVFDDEDF